MRFICDILGIHETKHNLHQVDCLRRNGVWLDDCEFPADRLGEWFKRLAAGIRDAIPMRVRFGRKPEPLIAFPLTRLIAPVPSMPRDFVPPIRP